MSKEQGNSAECVKKVAQENRDFFMVEGPDGKPKISALSKAFLSAPTPEQMKELQKGGVAVDLAMLNKMDMLAVKGSTSEADSEKLAKMEDERGYVAAFYMGKYAGYTLLSRGRTKETNTQDKSKIITNAVLNNMQTTL